MTINNVWFKRAWERWIHRKAVADDSIRHLLAAHTNVTKCEIPGIRLHSHDPTAWCVLSKLASAANSELRVLSFDFDHNTTECDVCNELKRRWVGGSTK